MIIKETIVVEGRDDRSAVERAVEAPIIETHGFGISEEKWTELAAAYERTGLIIFTDPDFSGLRIRERLKERFPLAKEAFLTKEEAFREGDIGIENAKPSSILSALEKVHFKTEIENKEFLMQDLVRAGLCGKSDAKDKRQALGKALGIGYGSNRRFLEKLNAFGITRKEFEEAVLHLEK